jgi:hypothetical protein
VRDQLDQLDQLVPLVPLVPLDSVLERPLKVERELVRPVEGDQGGDRDQAPVALGEAGPLPYLAEQGGAR